MLVQLYSQHSRLSWLLLCGEQRVAEDISSQHGSHTYGSISEMPLAAMHPALPMTTRLLIAQVKLN